MAINKQITSSDDLGLHDLLAFAYFLDSTVLLLFPIVEDWQLGIITSMSQAIEAGTRMSSAKALTVVRIVIQHGRIHIAMLAWALHLCNVLAHVVWLGTTAAFQLPLLGVRKDKVRRCGAFALVNLAVVTPAWMGRAMTLAGILVIVDDWELFIIARLVPA